MSKRSITAVGIDLGTTMSAVAHVNADGEAEIILNAEGQPTTPSVVCFTDQGTLVGEAAKDIQGMGTDPAIAFFKREIGDRQFVFQARGVDYTAVDLSALVLKKLKADAEKRLNRPITHAVITVPAYFMDVERTATIEAGRAAGLEVLQVINEPTAAAVAYGVNKTGPLRRVLVYDLGGGTFDITALELGEGRIQVLASDGDHKLGGKDWDQRIVDFLASRFEDEFGFTPLDEAEGRAEVMVAAEEAKKKLSSLTSTRLVLNHLGHKGRYELDRNTFESLTADLMERTVLLTKKVIDDLDPDRRNIDGVLLVGGSTRMPMVHRYVEDTFGKPPMGGVHVDQVVALGAALVAKEQASAQTSEVYALPGIKELVDVTTHSLGMIAENADRSAYINSIILRKNQPIPSEETRPFQQRTRPGESNPIEVYMTQGESGAPDEVSYIGRYTVHDVPHTASGLTVVDVQYRYDRSGVVDVQAKVAATGHPLRITKEPVPLDVPERFVQPPSAHDVFSHVTAYLAFDVSGSMSGRPLREAKTAAKSFVHNSDLTRCSIGIVAVSDRVRVKLEASQNANELERAIDALAVGETGYGNRADPFDEFRRSLDRRDSRRDGRRFGIVLADGVWMDQSGAIGRAKACHQAEIDIIAIGFGGADEAFLKAIASSEEGSFWTSLDGLVDTFSGIAQVLTETGGGAYPTKSSGGRLGFLSALKGPK